MCIPPLAAICVLEEDATPDTRWLEMSERHIRKGAGLCFALGRASGRGAVVGAKERERESRTSTYNTARCEGERYWVCGQAKRECVEDAQAMTWRTVGKCPWRCLAVDSVEMLFGMIVWTLDLAGPVILLQVLMQLPMPG